ncbi:hypothetical protein Q1695_001827 [Nippostrongylus brasiliensis]|nr:hypothetical protein Q1695_001827 [Nippostrongylus brasiliensis]
MDIAKMERYVGPVNPVHFPQLTISLCGLGLFFMAWFLVYEVTSTKYTRNIVKELLIATIAAFFLGFGSLFLLLWYYPQFIIISSTQSGSFRPTRRCFPRNFSADCVVMDGDCVAHEPKVFGSSRSNIPRPTTGRAPQPSPAVKAARNLKRKSIDHLSHLSATQAKKSAFSSGSSALYKVSAPLPDSARTGRATLATPSSLPRYLQTTAASARRAGVGNASRIGAARAPPSMPNRRSLTPVREDPICAQLRSEKEQLKGENTKLNAELTLIKNQITLQSQNLEMMQACLIGLFAKIAGAEF